MESEANQIERNFPVHEVIISSGNMHSRPDIYYTVLLNKKEEYQAIVDFCEPYIKPKLCSYTVSQKSRQV